MVTVLRAPGILALVVFVLASPLAMGQFIDLDQKKSDPIEGITDPEPYQAPFCVGNPCPDRTCDEVNDICVGIVALQPAMGDPLIGLSAIELQRFEAGKTAFVKTFNNAEGLGPGFNKESCGGCHNNPVGGSGSIFVERFGALNCIDFFDPSTCSFDPLDALGGSLRQRSAIDPACQETFPPGTSLVARRITNSTLGFGLVESIPDVDILFYEANPPSALVSGRTHVVPILEDPPSTGIGRFGWKSQLATILSFSADASLMEMGITNRVLPNETAPNGDPALILPPCDNVPDPEDQPDAGGVEFIDRVTDFSLFLAAPPQTPLSGMTGETVFNDIGCADCHVSSFVSGASPVQAIAGAQINAYSDFLLHDMGFNGDFIEQGGAGVTELRTAPLWGLRVRDPLWHDGRVVGGTFAFRMESAIALHNDDFGFGSFSEAADSALAYAARPQADKDALIAFLDSLGRREFDFNGDDILDRDNADPVRNDLTQLQNCFTGPGLYLTPDDYCSIGDADRDGDVDQDDVDLFDVATGVYVPPVGDDEDDDEDGDDEVIDDGSTTIESQAGLPDGLIDVMAVDPATVEKNKPTADEASGASANPKRDLIRRRGAQRRNSRTLR